MYKRTFTSKYLTMMHTYTCRRQTMNKLQTNAIHDLHHTMPTSQGSAKFLWSLSLLRTTNLNVQCISMPIQNSNYKIHVHMQMKKEDCIRLHANFISRDKTMPTSHKKQRFL